MDFSISVTSMGMMVINIAFGFIAPAYIYFQLRKKSPCESKPLWAGCAIYILVVLILENIANNAVLSSSMGALVSADLFSFGIYSGLIAGVFENVGRFLAFKLLKKYYDNDANALSYAVGHAGFEMFILLILPMVSYMSYAMAIRGGNTASLFAELDEAQAATLTATLTELCGTPSLTFLVNLLERAASFAVQTCMSVLVWFAAKKESKRIYLLAAIVLHTVINAVSVIISGSGVPYVFCVIIMCAIAVLYALLTLRIWKKEAEIKPYPTEDLL